MLFSIRITIILLDLSIEFNIRLNFEDKILFPNEKIKVLNDIFLEIWK